MFLCDMLGNAANTLDNLGILELPVIGNVLISLIDFIAGLLDC